MTLSSGILAIEKLYDGTQSPPLYLFSLANSVGGPISCAITAPSASATVVRGTPVTITGTVSASGTVAVKLGGVTLGAATMSGLNWSYSWTPTTAQLGAQTIGATATATSGGATGVAAGVAVSVVALVEVATRGSVPNAIFANTNNINSRSVVTIRSGGVPVTALQVVHANWYTNNGTETAPASNTMTQTLALEYPVGTLIGTFQYSGVATGSCATGADLVTDLLTGLNIPDGSDICITRCAHWTSNYVYTAGPFKSTAKGDASIYNDGSTDRTHAGVFADDGVAFCMNPTRVIGYTSNPQDILEIGDSRSQGLGETALTQDASGDCGQIARRIGPTRAYWRVGGSGGGVGTFIASNARSLALLALAPPTKVINSLGFNDLGTAATVEAGYASISALLPAGTPVYLATVSPQTTSTDTWETTTNQTPSAKNAQRIVLNAFVRAAVANGYAGFCEVADSVESTRDSGLWKVDGTANKYTGDGTHGTAFADKQPAFVVP